MVRVVSWLVTLCLVWSSVAFAANTHGQPDVMREMRATFKEMLHPFVLSGCAPTVPGSSDTLTAFACAGYVDRSGERVYVTQPSAGVGPLNGGPGFYWLALHHDRTSTVGGWTRQAQTHYLWQLNPTQPSDPAGGMVFARATMAGGVITAVRLVHRPNAQAERVIDAVRDCGVMPTSHLSTVAEWPSQSAALQACLDSAVPYTDVSASTRARVHLPTGQYYLATQVEVPQGISLSGDGKFVTILASNTSFAADGLLKVVGPGTGAPTHISGLAVTVFNTCFTTGCIGINASINGTHLRDVWVSAFDTGVKLGSSTVSLSDFVVELNTTGIHVTYAAVTVAQGELGDNVTGLFVDTSAVPTDDEVDVKIVGVREYRSHDIGYLLTGKDIQMLGTASYADGSVNVYATAGMRVQNATRVQLIGHHAHVSNGPHPVAPAIQILSNSSNVTLTGCDLSGFRYGLESSGTHVNVSACQASGNKTYGFRLVGGHNQTLTGNQAIENGDAGIADAGFYISNSDSAALFTLTGNTALGDGTPVQEYGFDSYLTGAGSVTYLLGNVGIQNGTANYRENGTQAQKNAMRNRGPETGIAKELILQTTEDFPSTAAHTESSIAVVFPGVVLADVDEVTVTPANGVLTGMLGFFTARTTADDEVTIIFHNYTTVTQDPLNGTFTLVARKKCFFQCS